ncbi:MAG: phage tail tape measure protein [Clostridiales bacterium]|nr:phage tail tape measure protein [Clostridiales bacterium]
MGRINTLLSLDGEAQFKRALHDINNNLKTLGKEFTSLQSDLSGTTNKMDLATRTSENLKNQLDFLARKHDLLTAAVQRAEAEVLKSKDVLNQQRVAYGANAEKLKEAQNAYDQSTQKIREYESKIKSLGGDLSKITLQGQQWRRELEREKAEQQRSAEEVARLKEAQTQLAREIGKTEKTVEKNVDTVHRYSQMLAENDTQLHKTETEQRRLNETSAETSKRFNQESIDAGKLANNVKALASKFAELSAAMVKAEFKGVTATFQAINKELEIGFQGLKKYTEAFTAATVAVGGFAAKNGMDFEASMSKVAAYSGVSTEEMQQLSAAAKDMGATTSKTASQAADALGYLALNGYKTEEMLSSLKPIVKASEAGGMDLAQVADLVANSLTSYGKSAEDAEEFLNVLTATQSNSSANLEQLLTTYRELSGTFNILNVDFNESATLLGGVANRGLKGAEAGTALNSVMLRLLGTNKKANTALTEFGISAWNEDGTFKGLTNTLNEVNAAMARMTDQEKVNFESQISGVLRFQDFQKLLAAAADTEEYNSLYSINQNASANNVLYSTAEIMMNNLRGKVTLLKSATEALGISIFETFSDRAVDNVKRFTQWINILNEGVQNGEVIEAFDKIGTFMTGAVVRTINQVKNQLPGNLRIFNAFILEGVDVLIRAMHESKTKIIPKLIKGARDLVLGLIERLPEFLSELTDGALIMFTGIVDALDQISVKLVEKLPELIKTLGDALTGDQAAYIFETGFQVLMTLLNGIIDNLPTIMEYAGKLLKNICKGIRDHVGELVAGATAIIKAIANFLSDDENLDSLLATGESILGAVVNALVQDGVLAKLVEAALSILERLGKYLFDNCEDIFEVQIPKIINTLVDQICTEDNDRAMKSAGNYLGAALIKGLKAAITGMIKVGIHAGGKGVGLIWADANGLEGEERDTAGNMWAALADAVTYGGTSGTSSKPTRDEVTAAAEETAKQSKELYATLERENYKQWLNGQYDYQGMNDAGTVAWYKNAKGDYHVVNLYSPVFNNASDIEQTTEAIAQMQAAAVAGGGKY